AARCILKSFLALCDYLLCMSLNIIQRRANLCPIGVECEGQSGAIVINHLLILTFGIDERRPVVLRTLIDLLEGRPHISHLSATEYPARDGVCGKDNLSVYIERDVCGLAAVKSAIEILKIRRNADWCTVKLAGLL